MNAMDRLTFNLQMYRNVTVDSQYAIAHACPKPGCPSLQLHFIKRWILVEYTLYDCVCNECGSKMSLRVAGSGTKVKLIEWAV